MSLSLGGAMTSAKGVLPWTTQPLGIQFTWYPGGCVPTHATSLIW